MRNVASPTHQHLVAHRPTTLVSMCYTQAETM